MTLSTEPLDLALDADGDLVVSNGDLSFVSGVDGVVQLIKIVLATWKGEWFANLDHGMPWDQILGQKVDEAFITNAVRSQILAVADVVEIAKLDVEFDSATRTVTVTFQVRTVFGDTDVTTVEL